MATQTNSIMSLGEIDFVKKKDALSGLVAVYYNIVINNVQIMPSLLPRNTKFGF